MSSARAPWCRSRSKTQGRRPFELLRSNVFSTRTLRLPFRESRIILYCAPGVIHDLAELGPVSMLAALNLRVLAEHLPLATVQEVDHLRCASRPRPERP